MNPATAFACWHGRSLRLGRPLLLAVDRVGEPVQVGAERVQEALDGQPLNPASASLDARDVGRVHPQPTGKLLLGETRLVAQVAQRTTEHDQSNVSGGVAHSLRSLVFRVRS